MSKRASASKTIFRKQNQKIQTLVDNTYSSEDTAPKKIQLEDGVYSTEEGLQVSWPVQIQGKGAAETEIISKKDKPAIRLNGAKNCSIQDAKIVGAIQCSSSELLVENCHIVANEEGICIEAYDHSEVTFSGVISGNGGIAIRANGESKVYLRPPYQVSEDEYVIADPKSHITIEIDPDEEGEASGSTETG